MIESSICCTVIFCTVLFCTVLLCPCSTFLSNSIMWLCPVLLSLVLFHPVLFCPGLFCRVLFCLVLLCLVQFCLVPYRLVLFCPVLFSVPINSPCLGCVPMPGCWELTAAILMQKFPDRVNPTCPKIPCYIKRRNEYWKHKDLGHQGYAYSLESNQTTLAYFLPLWYLVFVKLC